MVLVSGGLQPRLRQPVRTRAEKLLSFGRQSECVTECLLPFIPPLSGRPVSPPGAWVSWPVEWGQQFDLISGMTRDVLGTGPR